MNTPPAENAALPAVSTASQNAPALTTATLSSVAPANSPYPALFPAIADACSRADYIQAARLAEAADMHMSIDHDDHQLLITAPLVLVNLILDDIPPARFALFRLPVPLTETPLARALFGLMASVSERRHAQVYARTADLRALVAYNFSDIAGFGQTLTSLADAFLESFRTRVFSLLARAYTVISLQLAEAYLGLPDDQLLSVAQAHNWQYDSGSQLLTPVRQPTSVSMSMATTPSTLITFEKITDNVAALEA